jgi:mannose-6-phosphate isomerase-like protein (cupin superfamily)
MQSTIGPFNLASTFLRLRGNLSAEPLPVNDAFWQDISTGKLGDFHNEHLVAIYDYATDWPKWEMHPNGDEIVCLLSGSATFILEMEDGTTSFELNGDDSYLVVSKGVWHTAKTSTLCRMLFITAAEGTQHRGTRPCP